MEIIEINSYLDGGTIEFETTEGIYCVDNRFSSKETKNLIYLEYPKKNNSNIVTNQSEIKNKLTEAINNYKPKDSGDEYCIEEFKKIL